MKRSELSFSEGFLAVNAEKGRAKGASIMAFDWDKAGDIIKCRFKEHQDLVAEAGLQGDWDYTGGVIFNNGSPTNKNYTYLSSNWATPTLILSWDGIEQEEIECFTDASKRLNSYSKWDDESLKILGIGLSNFISNEKDK